MRLLVLTRKLTLSHDDKLSSMRQPLSYRRDLFDLQPMDGYNLYQISNENHLRFKNECTQLDLAS